MDIRTANSENSEGSYFKSSNSNPEEEKYPGKRGHSKKSDTEDGIANNSSKKKKNEKNIIRPMWMHAELSKNIGEKVGEVCLGNGKSISNKEHKIISEACRNFVKNVTAQNELRFAGDTKDS